MAKEIEVFADLTIRGPIERRPALRLALTTGVAAPWSLDEKRIQTIPHLGVLGEWILFKREPDETYPEAGLSLLADEDGFRVPNIVPLKTNSLTIHQYNSILLEFAQKIAQPAARPLGFEVEMTGPYRNIEDWLSETVSSKLETFSAAANKATGASHPRDEQRWYDFLIAAHREHTSLSSDVLARWLHEIDGWDVDTALHLAGQYENSLSLLKRYDEQR